jgi:DNA-binding transcriptional regulator YhcF (GntR family)
MSLAEEITTEIRLNIMDGTLKVGDLIPSVRSMAARWNCAPGTVQRAYRELAVQGLITTQVGQGSRVASSAIAQKNLRSIILVNRVEAFLLEITAAGFTAKETEAAVNEVFTRWGARSNDSQSSKEVLRFVGSHDPIISLISNHYPDLAPDCTFNTTFVGSIGGLMALARLGANIAGCRLWDAESDSYNVPYINRILPGRRVALITLARRGLGCIVFPGNPKKIQELSDLERPDIRFINRQSGTNSRLWLDTRLRQTGLDSAKIRG